MLTEFETNDKVQMRKPHACGANEWQIIRTGADVKIKCLHCGRIVMLARQDFEKAAKKNLGKGGEA
ncbi:MAG: DUF951 domain-containing protein [Clostridia bacterium]|nr:DUF951 domain-containing protein [Candidatus Pelethousia sp.]NCB31518.1 DUF951 domain-containing protein [Clostridia bacterium]